MIYCWKRESRRKCVFLKKKTTKLFKNFQNNWKRDTKKDYENEIYTTQGIDIYNFQFHSIHSEQNIK